MPTVGEMLREAREARNWTIDQIAQLTHVRMHYLQALEEDRRADLPSDVQARGYIRLYASALGLPAQPSWMPGRAFHQNQFRSHSKHRMTSLQVPMNQGSP